jgi:hypothetical protein
LSLQADQTLKIEYLIMGNSSQRRSKLKPANLMCIRKNEREWKRMYGS